MRKWRRVTRHLKTEAYAVYLAARHPSTPWPVRLLALAVILYALSPIDLIPDPIPVLGYLDDLVLVPLGLALVARFTPPEVMLECRARAAEGVRRLRPVLWTAAGVVIATWLVVLGLIAWVVLRLLGH